MTKERSTKGPDGQGQPKDPRSKRARRLKGIQLMKVVQEAALEEWNNDPGRPRWDRQGSMVVYLINAPAGTLYYLEGETAPLPAWVAEAPEEARHEILDTVATVQTFNIRGIRWATIEDHFESQCASALLELADFLGKWSPKAEALVRGEAFGSPDLRPSSSEVRKSGSSQSGYQGGFAARKLRDLWSPAGASSGEGLANVTRALAELSARDKTRKPSARVTIAWETRKMLKATGRRASPRELALASILCGVEGAPGFKTVSQAILAEARAMAQAMKRYPEPVA